MKKFLVLIFSLTCLLGTNSSAQTFEHLPLFSREQANFSDWVQKKIKYPKKALASQITGEVIVCYSVLKNRHIDKIQILSDSPEILNSEVIRILHKSPQWERAGRINQRTVELSDTLTIRFTPDEITVIPSRSRPTFQGKHFTCFSNWITSQLKEFDRITIYFSITEKGKLENIHITECTPPNIRDQLIKIILKSPTWQPATRHGKPFRSNENVVIYTTSPTRTIVDSQ